MVTISLLEFRKAMPSATARFSRLLAADIMYYFLLGLFFCVILNKSSHYLT